MGMIAGKSGAFKARVVGSESKENPPTSRTRSTYVGLLRQTLSQHSGLSQRHRSKQSNNGARVRNPPQSWCSGHATQPRHSIGKPGSYQSLLSKRALGLESAFFDESVVNIGRSPPRGPSRARVRSDLWQYRMNLGQQTGSRSADFRRAQLH